MKNLNNYINEAWSGVKKQTNKTTIETWCDKMGIENYTINSQGEIDVDGDVDLDNKDFKELPYKFGRVKGSFTLIYCTNLTSLKNCPDFVTELFACDLCRKLDSLEGYPKKIKTHFYCHNCKRKFTIKEVKSLCTVGGRIKLT